MDKKMINILREIKEFRYIEREWNAIKAEPKTLYIANVNTQPYTHDALLVFYSETGEYVELGIYGNFMETIFLGISWRNLDNKIVEYFSSKFQLEKIVNLNGDSYCKITALDGTLSASLAIKKTSFNPNYFLTIYYYDDGESRRNPNIYVHGIWEVELSEEFKKELYPEL